jgi:sugar (pentulose or hexulose) kinase
VEGDVTDLLMGIDVGTTLCKAALVTPEGREVAHGRRPTPWVAVPTGAEVDPHALAEASIGEALDALAAAPDGLVRGIGVCSMGETGVMLDGRGEPRARHRVARPQGGPETSSSLRDGAPASSSNRAPRWSVLDGAEARRARGQDQVAAGRRWQASPISVQAGATKSPSLARVAHRLPRHPRVAWWPDA